MASKSVDMTSSSSFFDVFLTFFVVVFFVSLVKFSYCSKFHVNVITCSGVRQFFYKGLTRNRKIRITPVWVLPNIWRLGQVRDSKFSTNISNEMSLNAVKCQCYSFFRFWVIKGKSTGGRGINPPPPPPHPITTRLGLIVVTVWLRAFLV